MASGRKTLADCAREARQEAHDKVMKAKEDEHHAKQLDFAQAAYEAHHQEREAAERREKLEILAAATSPEPTKQ